MFTLPEKFDGSFLLGKTIETICFGQYQININLSDGIWLQIEGRYEHLSADGRLFQKGEGFPLSETTLIRLLDSSILKCRTIDGRDLLLEMSNGDQLSIMGDNGMYEAYRIFNGEKEIVV